MALSDYNYLRQMLGYSKVTLGEDEYILQIKARIYNETGDFTVELLLEMRAISKLSPERSSGSRRALSTAIPISTWY